MKKFLGIGIVSVVGVSAFFIAYANTVESRVLLSTNDVHNGLFFAAADTVIIDGIINGDAYVAANQVIVNGAINGDLFAAGNTVTINGRIAQDARVAGSDIEFNGSVGKNVSVAGRTVGFSKNSDTSGSVLGAAQTVSFNGMISKEIVFAGQTATLNGFVGEDVRSWSKSMTVQRDAKLQGSLSITIPQGNLVVVEGSLVRGGINEEAPASRRESAFKDTFAVFSAIWFFLSTALLGIVMLLLFPRQSDALISLVRERPWRMFGWGAVWLIVVPVIIVALFVSIVGIALSALLAFAYGISLLLTHVVMAYFIGTHFVRFIFKRDMHRVWRMLLGLLLYYLIFSVPIVGPFAMVLGIVFGLGAFFVLGREAFSRLSASRASRTV